MARGIDGLHGNITSRACIWSCELPLVLASLIFVRAIEGFAELMQWSNSMAIIAGVLSAIFFLFSFVMDWRYKVARDWAHWAGFAVLIVFVFLPWIVSFFALRYLGVGELFGE